MRPRPLVTAGVLAAATVLVITGAAGCRRKASPPPAPAPAPIVAPTAMQLPDDAAPVRYLARFEVDPAAETFHGHVEITVTLARPLRALWLDAKDLTIHAATWRISTGDFPLRVLDDPAAPDRRGFTLEPAGGPVAALQAGEATLVIDYDGRQTAEQSYGLRRKEDRGDWYIVTQHEATGARRAAPCFDEPRFKVPWQVELTVPAGMMALSNAPVDAEDDLPDGRHHVRFAATPPIPSYLLALAVGPFDAVDAGATRGGAPMRIIVPRGRGDDARYVAGEVGKLVAALEDYTGIPYPYAKLDSIVVPGAPRGAMENPGLITYAPRLLLIPDDESDATRRTSIEVMAHELAHQWFGDLVTMRWWDDIWLNEAFASWAEPWVVDQVHPELAGGMTTVDDRRVALDADGLATARTIRQPVDDEAALGKAFDRITYQKGATVIRMFEQWLGADVFRRGVQRYLTAFAWKNATAADFLAAIGDAADRDVATPFSTFLDASGAPLVELELSCPAGKPAVLAMHQRRWLRSGHAEAPPRAAWQTPVCVRVADETEARCTLLTGATGELPLGDACPAW
ncbi:MAG: M1 family peptidase, partial [Myxococcales bacterium]|nr:M1 family peptidase [Myxococcales bacterium]